VNAAKIGNELIDLEAFAIAIKEPRRIDRAGADARIWTVGLRTGDRGVYLRKKRGPLLRYTLPGSCSYVLRHSDTGMIPYRGCDRLIERERNGLGRLSRKRACKSRDSYGR
jgi:hypothetical protein